MKRIVWPLVRSLVRDLALTALGFLGLGCVLYGIALASQLDEARDTFWSIYLAQWRLAALFGLLYFTLTSGRLIVAAKLYGRRRGIDFRDVAEGWFVHQLHHRNGHAGWSRDQFYRELRAARRARRATDHRAFMGHKRKRTCPKNPPPAP